MEQDLGNIIKSPHDKYERMILDVTNTPKSAAQISQECKIPIWTTYRVIHDLYAKNILKTSFSLKDGRKCIVYKNRIDKQSLDLIWH
ncbi:MAG: ArsR family transcriptional regulator [Thaumarchaeota archaeon]|nr:ArsR family transcriptional regulator [Nitrososphaerota archaeon]